ncbi:unnamed protein product [Rhizophagus irregularis]|nr:unnamed protein product [Rhizophagus irregularis]
MNWIISSIFGIQDWLYGISKVQDAHLETLTLTSALNSVSEFGFRIFLMDLFQLRLWIRIFFSLGLGFSLGAANLEQLDNRLEFSFDWTILNFI